MAETNGLYTVQAIIADNGHSPKEQRGTEARRERDKEDMQKDGETKR